MESPPSQRAHSLPEASRVARRLPVRRIRRRRPGLWGQNDASYAVMQDFGGHAGRNEFHVDGRMLLSNAGTQSIADPSTYKPSAARRSAATTLPRARTARPGPTSFATRRFRIARRRI
jgi:hypothetical protein